MFIHNNRPFKNPLFKEEEQRGENDWSDKLVVDI